MNRKKADSFNRFQDLILPIEFHSSKIDPDERKRRNSYYQGKIPTNSKRVIEKSGHRNVVFSKIPERSWRYCKDIVTTLIEQQWRYTFTMFALSFFLSWFIFAILWYLIGYAHGDLLFDESTGRRLGEDQDACVIGATSFAGFFTFSVETQVSIGYGEKYPSEECPEGVFLIVAQIIVGIAIEGAMVGIVYAKMSRPVKRITKLKFSKKAVICQRDGKLCFLFRVCDPREQQTIGTKIKVYFLTEKRTSEGENLGKCGKELKIEDNGTAFIMWPLIVCHIIDKASPLYNIAAADLLTMQFEIVVSLVGSSPSTGQIEQQWRYTFTMFALSFFLSWFIFAILWYLIGYAHGDLLFDESTGRRLGEDQDACVIGATSFAGFFTFSVETQVSIGYGEKYPSEECPEGVFLIVAQIIVGIAIEGAMVGIVYAKMSRPVKRITKLKFSKKAVICQRDGKLCFLFRVCDPREQQTIGTKIKVYFLTEKRTSEGENLGKCGKELKIEDNGTAFIMWPLIVCHIIDKASPLYNIAAADLLTMQFEIVVSLVGSSPSTGQVTESRTSYLPKEIFWGQRFLNIIHYDWVKRTYMINYDEFHLTILVETPLCSAKKLDRIAKLADAELFKN